MAIGRFGSGGGWTPPVGYVWLTVDNVSPATYFENTVWELISQNRVLMGAGDGHEGGDTEEAGLPNITGFVDNGLFVKANHKEGSAISASNSETGGRYKDGTSTEHYLRFLELNASWCNSIYGNSTTVQPPAYYVYIWRRAS